MSKPITCEPGCFPLQYISKSLFICSVDFLVRIASTRSNAKTVSQTEHIHAIGFLVWSLKTVAVRTGIAIVSHRPRPKRQPDGFQTAPLPAPAVSFAIRGSIVQCAVSVKLCECGCGKPAPLAKLTNRRLGYVKGQPVRFIKGHNRRHGQPRQPTCRRADAA